MAEANSFRGLPRLRRAATSFPGNLHLVLVLRPTSLLHSPSTPSSSGTDLGFRFSQEDFLLKMPVVMLSSVTDLLRYIDENQLSSEFAGTLEYCHSDWVVLRTAIENFAVTVKEIAQLLQSFGSELAETELPDEADAIELLLRSHTDKYRQMKDDIRSVMKQGRHLLANLETARTSQRGGTEDRDIKQDWDTVQRLLAQLRDMEMAFDGFFEKHHLKLQQYLQLLRYEINFHEMEEVLERLSAQEKGLASVGATAAQTEQLLRDLEILDTHAEEEMGRAQIIILHGHQLAASHHYAMALIVQRCNELRHHCDVITTAIRAKRASLTRARDLLLRLEEAMRWCDEGAYLLASQLIDRFQSKEGAAASLRDVERLQEGAPSALGHSPDELSLEFEAILTPQLQSKIAMVTEKVAAVQGMMQSRQACLRKLADLQARPIQLVAPRPEHAEKGCRSPLFSPKHSVDLNSVLNSRFSFDLLPGKRASRRNPSSRKIEVMHDYHDNHSCLTPDLDADESPEQLKRLIMKELIETERLYVEELLSVLLGYRAEMDNPGLSFLLSPELRKKKDVLFGNIPDIYQFHSRMFLQDLQGCLETPDRVGACFLLRKERFQVYERYCQNKPRSELLWREFSDSPFFQECQRKLEHKLALDSYLLKPVQRLTKYQLLLKELLKHSADSPFRPELQEALDAMLDLLKSVNDSMHQIAITGYEGDLCQLGRMLMQGSFSVWISHKRAATRMKELARFKPMRRHLFLYERALLFCKRRDDDDAPDRMPFYSFKHCLRMSAVGITENVKGDIKKFEIWYSGREEVYMVQAPTLEVKVAWLSELRKVLTSQQKPLQDETPPLALPENPLSPPFSDSVARVSVCMPWSPAPIAGCSACLHVLPNSAPPPGHAHLGHAHLGAPQVRSSGRGSPTLSEPVVTSPRPQRCRRSWPGPAHSVAVCEGLEDWGATDLSNISDSEDEDQPALLVAGRYRVMVDGSVSATDDDLIFKSGDVIQLLHEDNTGQWLVKNVSRSEEGRVCADDLHRILGDSCLSSQG